MKKAYVKPEIYFESFELSANIATGCVNITKSLAEWVCGVDVPGVGIAFTSKISGCVYNEGVEDGFGGVCYHNPSDSTNLFTS